MTKLVDRSVSMRCTLLAPQVRACVADGRSGDAARQHLLADSPDEITALTAFPSKPTFTDFSAPVNWQFGLAPPIFILKLGGGAGY